MVVAAISASITTEAATTVASASAMMAASTAAAPPVEPPKVKTASATPATAMTPAPMSIHLIVSRASSIWSAAVVQYEESCPHRACRFGMAAPPSTGAL